MDIRITQQFGQIGINYIYPKLDIATRSADMEIKQSKPELEITITPPEVHIDLSGSRADIGYKGILPFESENASQGQAAVQNGIARIAQEGDSLARSAGKGLEIIGQMAWNNIFDNKEVNIDVIPHIPPRISASGGINIDAKPGEVQVSSRINHPEMSFSWGKVNVFMEKEPMIKIEPVGTYVDLVR